MKTIIFNILTLLVFSINIFAQIQVPTDFPTIQQAIDNANADDIIIVANGTYTENLIIDKPITITSLYQHTNNQSDIANTIIDGNLSGSVIKAENINGTVLIKGLTIQNGTGSDFELFPNAIIKVGGGIFANNLQNLLIESIILQNNSITTLNNVGAGLFAKLCNLSISNSTIMNNQNQSESFGGDGSALYLIDSDTNILESLITNNESDGYDNDDIILVRNGSLSITNSNIINNTAGIVANAADITLENSNFNDMQQALSINGGYTFTGTSLDNISHTLVANNCDFSNNIGTSTNRGTVRLLDMQSDFTNCQFNDNINSYGISSGAISARFSIINIDDSEIKNNTASLYYAPNNVVYSGEGAGLRLSECNVTINNTELSNNACDSSEPFDKGGAAYIGNTDITFNNCTLKNNSADKGGVFYGYNSNITLNKTLVADNEATYGGFAYTSLNTIHIISSTIANNGEVGNTIYCRGNENYTFVNSILWNENNPEVFQEANSDVSNFTFSHSDIRGMEANFINNDSINKSWLTGNLDIDPLFVDAANQDYHLDDNSPLINAGIDYFEQNGTVLVNMDANDYFGSAPEIGAFEKQESLSVIDNITNSNIVIYTNSQQKIQVYTKDKTKINQVVIYNTLGEKLIKANRNSSNIIIPNSIKSGTVLFFIITKENGETVSSKMIK